MHVRPQAQQCSRRCLQKKWTTKATLGEDENWSAKTSTSEICRMALVHLGNHFQVKRILLSPPHLKPDPDPWSFTLDPWSLREFHLNTSELHAFQLRVFFIVISWRELEVNAIAAERRSRLFSRPARRQWARRRDAGFRALNCRAAAPSPTSDLRKLFGTEPGGEALASQIASTPQIGWVCARRRVRQESKMA